MSKCARRECRNTSSSGIKCKGCSMIFYCSIQCRGDDWEQLHSYECDMRSGILLRDLLETTTKLGKGKFGELRQVCHHETGEKYALEEIPKSKVSQQKLWNSLNEYVSMRKSLDHKYIVPFLGNLKDRYNNYLLFSLSPTSDLRSLIQSRSLTEDQGRKIFEKLCLGVQELHSQGIPHRNIKTEFIRVDAQQNPFICDYTWDPDWLPQGASNRDWDYMAPEFIEGYPIRPQIDLWSLGIVLFELTHGFGPFEALKRNRKKRNIMNLSFNFAEIDHNAQDLISKLLVINPEERASIEEVLEHPYVTAEEIEINLGTVFYVNDKQCGIIKGNIIDIRLANCLVEFREISKRELISLKKAKKLIKKSKNLELKQSRKMKKVDRKITIEVTSHDKCEFPKQRSQLVEPPCIGLEQAKPRGIDIVRNAIAGSKNLQSNFYLYEEEEEDECINQLKLSRHNAFYNNEGDEDDRQDTESSKKLSTLNSLYRDDDDNYPSETGLSNKPTAFNSFSSKDIEEATNTKLNYKTNPIHSFYTQKEDDNHQAKRNNNRKPPGLHPFYTQEKKSTPKNQFAEKVPALHSFYTRDLNDANPRGPNMLGANKQSQYQINRSEILSMRLPQEKIVRSKKPKRSDKLFQEYKGEGQKAPEVVPETQKNNAGWFKRFFSGVK